MCKFLHLSYPNSTDLWDRDSDAAWLEEEVRPMDGTIRTIQVLLDNPLDLDSNRVSSDLDRRRQYEAPAIPRKRVRPLELNVQYFSLPTGKEGCRTSLRCIPDSQKDPDPAELYAIPEDSLPNLAEVEAWALNVMQSYWMHANLGWFRWSFLHFAST